MLHTHPTHPHHTTTWQCTGLDGEEAKQRILADMPGLNVVLVPEGSPVTMDYRLDRVRIFVTKDGKVASKPSQG